MRMDRSQCAVDGIKAADNAIEAIVSIRLQLTARKHKLAPTSKSE